MIAELILVRHGQSLANVEFPRADAAGLMTAGIDGRDADVPLTALGEQQAAAVGKWFATHPVDVVVTSPYRRARETWRIASEGLALPVPSTDDRLVDRLLGDLEMLTRAAVAARFPGEAARRAAAGEYRYAPPNGESFAGIEVRLSSFLADMHRDHPGKRVAVVAHDAVVLMMRAVVEQLTWDQVVAVEKESGYVRNASISRFVTSEGRLLLNRYNSVAHLA